MSDDPGVMGNLPRSRPGRRSDKRKGPAEDTASASARPKTTPARKPAARKASSARTASAKPRKPPASRRPEAAQPARRPQSAATDPIGGVVRVATKLAGTGLGIAAGVLRRLPRP